MNKSTIDLLTILEKSNSFTEYTAIPISQIQPKTKYKYSKINNDLNKLYTANFINKGLKQGRAETYYITEEGITHLNKIKDLFSTRVE